MNIEYSNWIMLNYPTPESAKNQCKEASAKMKEDFPELKRVRGHVYTPVEYQHWWLTTENGDIVDPTKHQFDIIIEYAERDESEPEPTGKCFECGDFCFANKNFCSEDCETSYLKLFL